MGYKIALSPQAPPFFHDPITGIRLSRFGGEIPQVADLPEEKVVDFADPVTGIIETNISNLARIWNAIKDGTLLLLDENDEFVEPDVVNKVATMDKGDKADLEKIKLARDLSSRTINDIRKIVNEISDLAILEYMLKFEKEKEKPRVGVLSLLEKRIRDPEVGGVGIIVEEEEEVEEEETEE